MTQPVLTPFSAVSFEKEWQFLCWCASPTAAPGDLSNTSLRELDWSVLLELAEEHGVLGVLAMRLQENDFVDVPTDCREKLQSRVRAQQLFTLSMTAELFRIVKELSDEDIECVLVKGPLVSLLAYHDPAVRSYVDLDLLVRHKHILAASQLMIGLGFVPDIPLSVIEAGKIPGEYLFKRAGTSQIIELHTERTFRYYPRPMPVEDYFARHRWVLLDGQQIPALCFEDEFVLNSIHGAKHFWERLMWVADIAAIVFRYPEIDWARMRQYASDVGASRMLHVALQLADSLLQVPVPAAMKEEVTDDAQALQLCKQVVRWLPSAGYAPPDLRERAFFRMRMRGGRVAGAAYLLRLSFSPTEEDWSEGAEEKRSGFWDAMQRPLRLLKKYGSKE